MLKAVPRYDSKWMKTDLQVGLLNISTPHIGFMIWCPCGPCKFPVSCEMVNLCVYTTHMQTVFTEDGLSKLWNELVRDGEIQAANRDKKEEEAENVKERKSPFDVFLEEWTWGQVCVCVCVCVCVREREQERERER